MRPSTAAHNLVVLEPLRIVASHEPEAQLVEGLCEGRRWAERALVDRFTGSIRRVLTRILGGHSELDDLVQEVFIRALERIGELRETARLRAFLTAIAVYVAREAIRRKRRRRWLLFVRSEEVPELDAPHASDEAREATRSFYRVLGTLDPDERIAFTLRHVEEMLVSEIAEVTGVSRSTVKRRLERAEAEFTRRVRADDSLRDLLNEGSRWR